MPGQDYRGHRAPVFLPHDLMQKGERLLPGRSIWDKIIGQAAQINRIDRVFRDKDVNVDRLIVLAPQFHNFIRVKLHVFAFLVLIARYNFVLGYLAMHGAYLLVTNPGAAFLVNLMEVYFAPPWHGG